MKLSRYIETAKLSDLLGISNSTVLLFSTISGTIVPIANCAYDKILQNNFDQIETDLIDKLIDSKILIHSNEDEFKTIYSQNEQYIDSYDTFYLAIQPNRMCQLSCTYCGQTLSDHVMSRDIRDHLTTFAQEKLLKGNYNKFHVGWFGSEPLLSMDLVTDLSRTMQQISLGLNVEYSSMIVTNGVLLSIDTAHQLFELGVEYAEITIDGTKDIHNARRRVRSGNKDMFTTIYTNIKNVLENVPQLKIGLRMNVDVNNCACVKDLVNMLHRDNVLAHKNFRKIYTMPVHNWGNDLTDTTMSSVEYSSWQIQWLLQLRNYGWNIHWLPLRKHIPCMVYRRGGALVDAYGNVYNCSEVSYVKSYEYSPSSNKYAIGNVIDLTSTYSSTDAAELKDFYLHVAKGGVPCAKCNLFPMCAGSCPKAWHEGEHRCPPEKYNLKQRMVLQYLDENTSGIEEIAF